ncbi:PAP2-domain-containing protein [Anaeromyces robustus]|jgi:diacylglycerol diphosphate phosphatase/phosphatidate phosphatase|uniref:PAP2-domain-containing protein n=1 Tax=Anaeromyces robustus TaxID=1754192 RepID=A0A1Y1W4W9_9FUNG|nr:PAP2-domain-containing protein [Anaeromyces robustus]|eukprot:ORX68448.1 PAP2-domain-containing protein [Anaeromyces robustus]
MANSEKSKFFSKKNKFYFSKSIIVDWIVLIIIAILVGLSALVHPFERQFSLDDVTISHPHKGDTITMMALVIGGALICFVVITGFQYYKKDLKYNYHQAVIGECLNVAASTLFAHVIKNMVGRYRPDFISVCDVDWEKVEEQYSYYYNISSTSSVNYGPRNLFNTTICKTSREELFEERRSFPSGHSAFAFCTMTYLSLYIAGQIHLLDKKSHLWKYFVVSLPMLLAVVVPLTRVFDYRHHWQDVTVGSILGVFFGIITYYYYYPSLSSPNCDIPYQRYDNSQVTPDKPEIMEASMDKDYNDSRDYVDNKGLVNKELV